VADVLEQLRSALIDRYEVERLLGEGGMATVFLAKDLRHGRQVAIKTLRAELAASIGADRFLREIRLAANLQHPNILTLYDSGDAGGVLYYVMPFVEGESLRGRLNREQQLPLYDAVRITREAAEGLAYAHEHGVVHRDIKPENILLQNNHAVVADFGIARAVDAAGEKLTQTGMAVGTPHYMSPEQALGSEHADGRSDVYSLGCVLYELLAGQPPFDGPNSRAIMARHSMEQVPSLQIVRPSVPDELEDLVLRSLEKTPADRFQSMREFCECLTEAEAEATVSRTAARRTGTAARRTLTRELPSATKGLGNRRRTMAIGAAVAALLVGGGAFAALSRSKPATSDVAAAGADAHRVAVLYFDDDAPADSLRYLADGLTEGLIRQLSTVQTLDVISANGVAPFRSDSVPRDSVARVLKAGTLVSGSVSKEGSRLRVSVRLIDGASGADYQRASFEEPAGDLLQVQDSLVQKVAALIRERLGEEIKVREQRESASSPQSWALVQRAEQARKRAEASLARADSTSVVERSFGDADSLYARAALVDGRWSEPLVGRATVAYRRSRLAAQDQLAAKSWIEKGEQFADSALKLSPENPDALETRGTLRYWGWLIGVEPDPAAAKRLLADAQSDLEKAVRVRPAQASAWAVLSHLYNQTGGETDAKLAARRAYEEDAYLANADQVLSRLFLASYDLGQFVDAAHWCDEGLRRFPGDFKFVSCQLWLLTTRAKDPDVGLAWKLADSLSRLAPAARREFETLKARMAVAAVLARANLPDSARHLAERSHGSMDVDPTRDLVYMEAFVRTILEDRAQAVSALKTYLAANPERRSDLADESGWWFRGLQDYPPFRELVQRQ
jgi:TolB-like protein